jgi:hypothetical protein
VMGVVIVVVVGRCLTHDLTSAISTANGMFLTKVVRGRAMHEVLRRAV